MVSRTSVELGDVPAWLANNLKERYESCVDGYRWVTDGHVALRVSGQTSLAVGGPVAELLASAGVRGAVVRVEPRATELEHTGTGHEPNSTECDECGEWMPGVGRGSMVGHYYVPMAGVPDLRLSLCYGAVIPFLFGDVEWYGSGPRDPVVAKVCGEVVAVAMPAPKGVIAPADA
jgi:hypothetical protein